MNERIHTLRTLALKLNVSGTAEVLDEQMLYQGGYGFVKLQVFVPATQNTVEAALCTVHSITIDTFGRERRSRKNYALWRVGDFTLDGAEYILYERYMPREFTEYAGELMLEINYCDTAPATDSHGNLIYDNNGVLRRVATDILVSNRYTTTVHPGGYDTESVDISVTGAEAAQITENMANIAALQDDVEGLHIFINDDLKEITAEAKNAVEESQYAAEQAKRAATDLASQLDKELVFVGRLPATGDRDKLYAVLTPTGTSLFDLYVYENGWRLMGGTDLFTKNHSKETAILPASGWVNNKQVIEIADLTDTADINAYPIDDDADEYILCGLTTEMVSTGIEFTCVRVPTDTISVVLDIQKDQAIPQLDDWAINFVRESVESAQASRDIAGDYADAAQVHKEAAQLAAREAETAKSAADAAAIRAADTERSVNDLATAAGHSAASAENSARELGGLVSDSIEIVDELPPEGDPDKLYILLGSGGVPFKFYKYKNGAWSAAGQSHLYIKGTHTIPVLLTAAAWEDGAQTVSIPDIDTYDSISVMPDDASAGAYVLRGVDAAAQGNGTLTFTAATTPTEDMAVFVEITKEREIQMADGYWTIPQVSAFAGGSIAMELTDDYVLTVKLKAIDGTELSSVSKDLPIESLVKSGRYDNTAKKIVLVLENDDEIEIPVADLISALATTAQLNTLADRVEKRISVYSKTITPSNWTSRQATVQVENATTTSYVEISPATTSARAYIQNGIYGSGQGAGTVKLTCATTPTENITIQIIIIN